MRERTIFAILAIIVLIIIPIEKSADYEEKAPISMSCMNVEREVRTILGKRDGDISKKDLKKIRTLNIESMLVERLVDIEKMPNLQKLVLVETCTDNLKALNNNKSLKSLDISKNELTDTELNELSDLDNLEEIYISYNKISDISALAKFKNLRIIFADHNYINDFTALESLENLERLVISGNNVRNEVKLPNLPNLEIINDEESTYEDIERQKNEIYGIDDEITYNQDVFREELYKQNNYTANDISGSDEEIQVMDLNFFVESKETKRENYDKEDLIKQKEKFKKTSKREDLNELLAAKFRSIVYRYQKFEEIMYENPDFNKIQIEIRYNNCVYYDDQDIPVTIAVPRFAKIEKVQYKNCNDWCEYED